MIFVDIFVYISYTSFIYIYISITDGNGLGISTDDSALSRHTPPIVPTMITNSSAVGFVEICNMENLQYLGQRQPPIEFWGCIFNLYVMMEHYITEINRLVIQSCNDVMGSRSQSWLVLLSKSSAAQS